MIRRLWRSSTRCEISSDTSRVARPGTGVYYEASEQAGPCVTIRAVGIKVRERVLIGGVEVDLS